MFVGAIPHPFRLGTIDTLLAQDAAAAYQVSQQQALLIQVTTC